MKQAGVKKLFYQYVLAILIVIAVSYFCRFLSNSENYHVVSFILLFVVSVLSTFLGIGPVILAATLSSVLWNYFFIPPHHTFNIGKTEDILIFGMFFIIAFVNGVLTSRVRKQERLARLKERRTSALYKLTRELSKANGFREILEVATKETEYNFKISPEFLLKDVLQKEDIAGIDPYVAEAAVWSLKNSKPAGYSSEHYAEINYVIFPLIGPGMNAGVLLIKPDDMKRLPEKSFWETFLAQISNALEREYLSEVARKVQLLDESDRLYKTLFNTISHEFRIPVATIMGASDAMLNSPTDSDIQNALSSEIFTASVRLNRLVENLLNMSRLETGHISLRLNWCDVNDLINSVSNDLKEELSLFRVNISIADDIPLIRIDFGLMQQALYNLLYNSTLYSAPGTVIHIEAKYLNGSFVISIADQGSGFPEDVLGDVFNKFFRGKNVKPGGLGLGLSIVKGFVEAHNGQVCVENILPHGAKFTISIPTEIPDVTNI